MAPPLLGVLQPQPLGPRVLVPQKEELLLVRLRESRIICRLRLTIDKFIQVRLVSGIE